MPFQADIRFFAGYIHERTKRRIDDHCTIHRQRCRSQDTSYCRPKEKFVPASTLHLYESADMLHLHRRIRHGFHETAYAFWLEIKQRLSHCGPEAQLPAEY